MCNEAARRITLDQLRVDWSQTRIPLRFPEGLPNMAPLDGFRITDQTVILRAANDDGTDGGTSDGAGDGAGVAELVTRRWSWPGAHGKPVYNFRSDGRTLTRGRCLIPVDAFYEFTAAEDPKAKRKVKWAFALRDHAWFCIAGLWRADPAVGEAFTMLTCPPGPDIAPYHDRQVVVLGRESWAAWLDPAVPAETLCRPLPAGSLTTNRMT